MKAWMDYHVHTRFCDGQNTPEEMVRAAIAKGMCAIGFSGHSYLPAGERWCMSVEGTAQYRAEIARLRQKYAGQIEILCGVEQDMYSETSTEGYDYVIGSVHFLLVEGRYIPVDESGEILQQAAAQFFGGDILALCEKYYETAALIYEKTTCDIIGHFDVITKFNEANALFDEQSPRYVAAWQKAADALLQSGKPFELNTGAISRGYRSVPYPSREIRAYLNARGGKLILSSDSHSTGTLCYQFEKWEKEGQLWRKDGGRPPV